MSNKLFVGGVSWNTDDAGLNAAFSEYGPVTEAKIILDRDTGRSRGFGFVTFENADDAAEAVKAMDGTELDGRRIRVNEAQERQRRPRRDDGPRGGGYGGGGGGGGGRNDRW